MQLFQRPLYIRDRKHAILSFMLQKLSIGLKFRGFES